MTLNNCFQTEAWKSMYQCTLDSRRKKMSGASFSTHCQFWLVLSMLTESFQSNHFFKLRFIKQIIISEKRFKFVKWIQTGLDQLVLIKTQISIKQWTSLVLWVNTSKQCSFCQRLRFPRFPPASFNIAGSENTTAKQHFLWASKLNASDSLNVKNHCDL